VKLLKLLVPYFTSFIATGKQTDSTTKKNRTQVKIVIGSFSSLKLRALVEPKLDSVGPLT